MSFFGHFQKVLTALILVLVLSVTTACGGATTAQQPTNLPALSGSQYAQLERGNTSAGQNFGDWVVSTAKGLVQDAYVRDNNKLGVVISPKVRPNEVKELARSLAQGFHHNFPNQDLSVLMYAPDKKLIMTANYDQQSNQIEYKVAS